MRCYISPQTWTNHICIENWLLIFVVAKVSILSCRFLFWRDVKEFLPNNSCAASWDSVNVSNVIGLPTLTCALGSPALIFALVKHLYLLSTTEPSQWFLLTNSWMLHFRKRQLHPGFCKCEIFLQIFKVDNSVRLLITFLKWCRNCSNIVIIPAQFTS